MNKYFWMSFCDPDKPKGSQFLGACIVPAINFEAALTNFEAAVTVSHLLGCNPGGEVNMLEIPPELEHNITPEIIGVILSMEDIETKCGGAIKMSDL